MKIQVILGERVAPYMYLFLLYLIREKIRLKRQYYVPIDSKHFTFRDIPIHSFDDLEKKAAYTFKSFIHSNVSEFNIELLKIHIVV